MDNIAENIKKLLADIQKNLFDKAATLRSQRTYKVDTWDEFVDVIENKSGFALAHWDGSAETEEKIKKELTKATIRCIPMDAVEEKGRSDRETFVAPCCLCKGLLNTLIADINAKKTAHSRGFLYFVK